jgi:hypothetical protein
MIIKCKAFTLTAAIGRNSRGKLALAATFTDNRTAAVYSLVISRAVSALLIVNAGGAFVKWQRVR